MIVVSGAGGNLGRRVVRYLLERRDAAGVVGLSRTPQRLADLHIEARYADFAEPASLPAAFDGAERLLIISIGGIAPEHTRQQADAVAAAAKAGVEQIVYTSIPRATEPGNPGFFAPYHAATERALAESGVPFTSLRFNMWPDMLTYAGVVARARATGVLLSNAGQGRVGYVSRDDSAAVAAAVLDEGGSIGETLEVTGPAAVSDAEIAELLGVRYEAVGDAESAAAMVAQGTPEPIAQAWTASGVHRRNGWHDLTTHAVARLTGRTPTSLAEFLAVT